MAARPRRAQSSPSLVPQVIACRHKGKPLALRTVGVRAGDGLCMPLPSPFPPYVSCEECVVLSGRERDSQESRSRRSCRGARAYLSYLRRLSPDGQHGWRKNSRVHGAYRYMGR